MNQFNLENSKIRCFKYKAFNADVNAVLAIALIVFGTYATF